MSDLSIVIVAPFFPPYPVVPGGAEHSLEEMCAAFVEAGWRVSIVTPCFGDSELVETVAGIQVTRFRIGAPLISDEMHDYQLYFDSRSYVDDCVLATEQVLAHLEGPVVLIANNAQSVIPVARARRRTGAPAIGIMRDAQFLCEMGACIDGTSPALAHPCRGLVGSGWCKVKFTLRRETPALRALPGIFLGGVHLGVRRRRLQKSLLSMSLVVPISCALKTMSQRLPGFDKKPMMVIRNFCTSVRTGSGAMREVVRRYNLEGQSFFLISGRKSYGKGTDLGVAAVRKLINDGIAVRLVLAGAGTLADDVEGVIDAGQLPRSELLELLSASSGLIVPGRCQEGLHRTMIDALSGSTPIICTEAGGVSEGVRDGLNGYIVPCGDIDALAVKMQSVLSWGEAEIIECQKASEELFSESFAKAALLSKWRSVFESLVGYGVK